MNARPESDDRFVYKGRPVSALGLRLRQIREQIDAAAARGELKLLDEKELQQELRELRSR